MESSTTGEYNQGNYSKWIDKFQQQIQFLWLTQNDGKNQANTLDMVTQEYIKFSSDKIKEQSELIGRVMQQKQSFINQMMDKNQEQQNELLNCQKHCKDVIIKKYDQYLEELQQYGRQLRNREELMELRRVHDDYQKEMNEFKSGIIKSSVFYQGKLDKKSKIRKIIRSAINKVIQTKGIDKNIIETIVKYECMIEKHEVAIDKKDLKLLKLDQELLKIKKEEGTYEEQKNLLQIQIMNEKSNNEKWRQSEQNMLDKQRKQQEQVNVLNYNLNLFCQDLYRKFTPRLLKLYEYKQTGIHYKHFRKDQGQSVIMSHEGKLALTNVNQEQLILWKIDEDKNEWQYQSQLMQINQIKCLYFYDEKGSFFTGLEDGQIVYWFRDNQKWSLNELRQTHQRGVNSIQGCSKNGLMISGSDDCKLKVWQIKVDQINWEVKYTLQGHQSGIQTVFFNRNSTLIGSGSFDKTIILWNLKNQEWNQYQILKGHKGSITTLCFSKLKDLLISGSQDNFIKIWEMEQNQLYKKVQTLDGHKATITQVIFNSDSSILISGSKDCTIKFWRQNISNRWVIHREFQYNSMISSISISNNNIQLIVGCFGGETIFYKSQDYWE
ncbi:unnamed protein product [Paramecium sonneborni]|uniref:WD40-repeat-containing domain n=1 Tax=Paramecium sonneborni TaxID=65129 RepID=A0A8S1RGP9_9CILI|nr:unnamed protein product [Paramecium sonneborni]